MCECVAVSECVDVCECIDVCEWDVRRINKCVSVNEYQKYIKG